MTLPELERRAADLLADIEQLQVQLKAPDVVVQGVRLEGREYRQWRTRANEARVVKLREYRRLKQLLKTRRAQQVLDLVAADGDELIRLGCARLTEYHGVPTTEPRRFLLATLVTALDQIGDGHLDLSRRLHREAHGYER